MKKKTKTTKKQVIQEQTKQISFDFDLSTFKTVKINDFVSVIIYEDRVYIENSLANQGVPLLKSTLKDIYRLVKNETN